MIEGTMDIDKEVAAAQKRIQKLINTKFNKLKKQTAKEFEELRKKYEPKEVK